MKKVFAVLLTLAMMLSLGVTAFAEDIVIPASGSELTDSNNSYEEDLTVTYTYTAPDTTAEKVFNVTVAFNLPANMELEYTDTQNVYTWDHDLGKYVLDTENSTEAAGELTDEGEFTITVTNRSNVPVEFDVAYTANTAAVFASEVTYTTDYENIALDTVADGHEIGTDGITITDVTAATTANTTFASADCTGKLSVTGINSGKEPGASGTDKLGTFTVTIAEGAAEEEKALTIRDILPADFPVLVGPTIEAPDNAWWEVEDDDMWADIRYNVNDCDGYDLLCLGKGRLELSEPVTKDDNGNYIYLLDYGVAIERCTFIMSGNTLTSIHYEFSGDRIDPVDYTFIPPVEEEEQEEVGPVVLDPTLQNLLGEGKIFSSDEWAVEFTFEEDYSMYLFELKNIEYDYTKNSMEIPNKLLDIDGNICVYDCGLYEIQFELEGTECKKVILTGELESLFHDDSVEGPIMLTLVG